MFHVFLDKINLCFVSALISSAIFCVVVSLKSAKKRAKSLFLKRTKTQLNIDNKSQITPVVLGIVNQRTLKGPL